MGGYERVKAEQGHGEARCLSSDVAFSYFFVVLLQVVVQARFEGRIFDGQQVRRPERAEDEQGEENDSAHDRSYLPVPLCAPHDVSHREPVRRHIESCDDGEILGGRRLDTS